MNSYKLTEKDYRIISALNRRNDWGFSEKMLMNLLSKYIKAYKADDFRSMAMYEERLTDANFHTECSLLAEKDFDGFRSAVRNSFKKEA